MDNSARLKPARFQLKAERLLLNYSRISEGKQVATNGSYHVGHRRQLGLKA